MSNQELRRKIKERANSRCEYCGMAQTDCVMPFHVEHIIPKQHGGKTEFENLALSCPHCNLHKGTNLTGIDPDTGELCRLFHPRLHSWPEHFQHRAARVLGLTPIGRTTVWLFSMNSDEQLELRS